MRKKNAKTNHVKSYGIIGLGRFGSALALSLAEAGKEILVIDADEEKVKFMRNYTEHAFVVRNLEKKTLEETGIQNCDVAVICIGEKIDTSILTTLHIVGLGVPQVIAKANSTDQGAVLEKIGAEVIYPERDMGVRLAQRLISQRLINFFELRRDIDISELRLSERIAGRTVRDLDIRAKYGLNIIVVEHENTIMTEISPDYVFRAEDVMVVIGSKEKIRAFELNEIG